MSRSIAMHLGITIGLIAVLAAGLYGHSWETSAVAASAPQDERLTRLAHAVDTLGDRQDALDDALDGALDAGLADATPTKSTPPAQTAPPADSPVETQEREAEFAGRLAARLQSERPDPAWSPAAEGKLQDWMADYHGASLQSASCGATLCRLEIAYPDGGAREEGMAALPLTEPWSAPGFARATADDQLHFEVFLAREGRALDGSATL